MNGCAFITHDQCDVYKREQKADWQNANSMTVEEVNGMRCEFRAASKSISELMVTITRLLITQEIREKTEKRRIQIGLVVLGILGTIIITYIGVCL